MLFQPIPGCRPTSSFLLPLPVTLYRSFTLELIFMLDRRDQSLDF